MFTILNIVKNKFNETIGYDIRNDETNQVFKNVKIYELVSYKFTNASYVNGKYPYIRGNKPLPIREENTGILLYHGSNHIVNTPIYHGGKLNNDYGYGFYMTQYPERAEEWALLMDGASYCNIYECNVEGLNVVNLDEYGPLAWVAEVLKNRGPGDRHIDSKNSYKVFCKKYCVDLSKADVIVGYRADDSYFQIIESFLDNYITIDEVVSFFYKAKLGRQIVFISKKSFDEKYIKFSNAYKVSNERLKYAKNNDNNARKTVLSSLRNIEDAVDLGKKKVGKLNYRDCLQTDYKYDKERKIYYV